MGQKLNEKEWKVPEHIAIILSLPIYKIQIEICSLRNILKDFLFLSG